MVNTELRAGQKASVLDDPAAAEGIVRRLTVAVFGSVRKNRSDVDPASALIPIGQARAPDEGACA
jgi:hypothetical protein